MEPEVQCSSVKITESSQKGAENNFFTLGFSEDGSAVTRATDMTSPDKLQSVVPIDTEIIDKKIISMKNAKKVIVKVDPSTGKKYIYRDGRRYEVVPQIKTPLINVRKDILPTKQNSNKDILLRPDLKKDSPPPLSLMKDVSAQTVTNEVVLPLASRVPAMPKGRSVLKIKSISKLVHKPKEEVEEKLKLEEQINPNIVIKRGTLGEILNGNFGNTVQTELIGSAEKVKYHVLSLNVKKQPPPLAPVTLDHNVRSFLDKDIQTDSVYKQEMGVQTNIVYRREIAVQTDKAGNSPLSEIFLDFILRDEIEDRGSDEVVEPEVVKDKSTSKEDEAKLKFFKDMQSALIVDRSGNLPIHESVMQNNLAAVKKNCTILRARKETINIPNQQLYTPLHLAVLYNVSFEVLKTLLQHGADLNLTDGEGNTVFHLAVEHNRMGHLKALLERAAFTKFNLDVFNFDGFTPLIMSCSQKSYEMARVLLETGADPNIKDMKSGRTALFHAAESFNVDIVQLLVKNKADPKLKNFFGTSPHDAMFDLDDVPSKIKLLILGRDHQRNQTKKKSETRSVSRVERKQRTDKTLQVTPVLKRISDMSYEFSKKSRQT